MNWRNQGTPLSVWIDAQNGIGSNSCGPELRDEYQVDEETLFLR